MANQRHSRTTILAAIIKGEQDGQTLQDVADGLGIDKAKLVPMVSKMKSFAEKSGSSFPQLVDGRTVVRERANPERDKLAEMLAAYSKSATASGTKGVNKAKA